MPTMRLDDCVHCAAFTELSGYTRERAILELADGVLGCENCLGGRDATDWDGHGSCVVLIVDGAVVFDNRCARGGRRGRR